VRLRARAQNVVVYIGVGFPVGWFELVGFRVLVGGIPFLGNQFLKLQNLIRAFHIKSAPPATRNLILRLFIGICPYA